MHPDPQEIIPDYCQSHIFYHLQFIFNGSAQCEVRLTFHIMERDKIVFLVSGIRRQKRMFTQDLKLNIIWRRLWDILTSWDSLVSLQNAVVNALSLFTELFLSFTSTVDSVSIICSISRILYSQHVVVVTISPPYIKALDIIPRDDMFLFSQPFQTVAALLSWHFQGIGYYSDVFIETYCLILYY